MESQLAIDPDPEPPSYRIHQEKRGKFSIWVITQNNKLITVLPKKILPTGGSLPDAASDTEFHILTIEDK